jgi:hypothetical protein
VTVLIELILGGCNHYVRDNHTLVFCCDSYEARFDVIPMHPFALHIREKMELNESFHENQAVIMLKKLYKTLEELVEKFYSNIATIYTLAKETMAVKPEEASLVLADTQSLESDILMSSNSLLGNVLISYTFCCLLIHIVRHLPVYCPLVQ